MYFLRIKTENRVKHELGKRLLYVGLAFLLFLALIVLGSVIMPAFESRAETESTQSVAGAADTKEPETSRKKVRVGWYESKFHQTDRYGRKSGYGYEYQRKVAAYTGWEYEYVEGSWPELFDMLKKGEIDLLTDVSYTEERAKSILYSSLPMGSESYYVFVLNGNEEITAKDVNSLEGKTIGVDKGSIMEDLFRDWAKMHNVSVEPVELSVSQDKAMEMLKSGEMDAYIMLDSFGDPTVLKPLWKIGSSDFYFALNKERQDLLLELDSALNLIQEENVNYHEQLYEKYLRDSGTNRFLSAEELNWLSDHGKIRVGYQDNYMAFCAKDEKTGELTGALKDYLAYASTAMKNATLDFEPVCYPTAGAALEALQKGEIDCMFPANLTDFDGEALHVVMTPALMTTEMDAVVREDEQKEFLIKDKVRVAVNKGNTNYEMFLADYFPNWERVYFEDTPAGLDAVAAGEADCVIISNYRFNNISKQCEKLNLTTVYTSVDMDYSFAVHEGQGTLYSILTKVTDVVPAATVSTALTYYSTEDVKKSFFDYVMEHLAVILLVIALIAILILALILRSIHLEKKASAEHSMVKELNRKVYVDALTNVRNKGAFNNFMKKLQDRVNKGKTDFAIGMLDCDNLKKVNDEYGHEKGDIYLKNATRLICHVFSHSPVFRLGGDEFAVVLEDEDFRNMEGLVKSFYRRKKEICELAENEWDEVHISLGIAVFDPTEDKNVNDTLARADKIMYVNKKIGKKHRSAV